MTYQPEQLLTLMPDPVERNLHSLKATNELKTFLGSKALADLTFNDFNSTLLVERGSNTGTIDPPIPPERIEEYGEAVVAEALKGGIKASFKYISREYASRRGQADPKYFKPSPTGETIEDLGKGYVERKLGDEIPDSDIDIEAHESEEL